MGVSVRRDDLEHAVAETKDRDVERSPTEVVDSDLFVLLLIQAVRERRGRGLVDDPQDLEPGDGPGVFGCLTLAVVEIGRDGDHRLGYSLSQVGFGVALELLENHRGDLLRRVLLATHCHPHVAIRRGAQGVRHELRVALHDGIVELPPHEALDRGNRVVWVGDRLPLGDLAHHPFTRLGIDRHHRWSQAAALRIRNHNGLAALHHRHNRVRCAEINADYFSHSLSPAIVSHSPESLTR